MTMDLFPTLCEVASVDVDHPIDGISLLPTIMGKAQPTDGRDLFFHRREGGQRYGGLTINAIRRGSWKLLQNSPFEPLELYNLASDPKEENNLVTQHPNRFRELAGALRFHVQRGGAVPWQRPERRDQSP